VSILVRFTINEPHTGPRYEAIAAALAHEGRGTGDEYPEFLVWGNGSYPKSTLIEYLRSDRLATALAAVNRAIDAAGVRDYCTGGDLHLPAEPIT
jgi:hypothetical protein